MDAVIQVHMENSIARRRRILEQRTSTISSVCIFVVVSFESKRLTIGPTSSPNDTLDESSQLTVPLANENLTGLICWLTDSVNQNWSRHVQTSHFRQISEI